jgi:hypothetical protein
MREREEDRTTGDAPAVPLPNQGGIGSSEHGGTDSSELVPEEQDKRAAPREDAGRQNEPERGKGTAQQGNARKTRIEER